MTEPQVTTGTEPVNWNLPKDVQDQILLAVKQAVKGPADEIVEEMYGKLEERGKEWLETMGKAQSRVEHQRKNRDHVIGGICMAVLRGRNNYDHIMTEVKSILGEEVADDLDAFTADRVKTLNLQDVTAGGILVQGDVRDEFYDVLRPRVAVLSLGPVEVPMPSRAFEAPGFSGDVTAHYVGEPNTSEIVSEPTTESRRLNAKTLITLVPISNQMIDTPVGTRITRFVERMAVERMRVRQDLALIRGDGSASTPRGLRNWASTASPDHVVASLGASLANILDDFGNALNAMEQANVPMTSVGVVMSPRSKNHLMFSARDADTKPFFLEEMRGGTILGIPFRATSNVPNTLGGGSESEVIFADFDQVMFGTTGAMAIQYFGEGSYTLSGTMVSAMERNEQVLRIVDEHDMNVVYTEAVYVITGIAWDIP